MMIRRLAALAAGAIFVLGACSNAPAGSGGGGSGAAAGCTVGVSWNNYSQ